MQQRIGRIGGWGLCLLIVWAGLWLLAQLDDRRQQHYRVMRPATPQPVSALLSPLVLTPLSEEQQCILMVDAAGECSHSEMARRYWESRGRDRLGTAVYLSELLRWESHVAGGTFDSVVMHGRRIDPDNVRYDYLAAALAMLPHVRIYGDLGKRSLRVTNAQAFDRALDAYVVATQRTEVEYRAYAEAYLKEVGAVLPPAPSAPGQADAWERFSADCRTLPELSLLGMLEESKMLSGRFEAVDTAAVLAEQLATVHGGG